MKASIGVRAQAGIGAAHGRHRGLDGSAGATTSPALRGGRHRLAEVRCAGRDPRPDRLDLRAVRAASWAASRPPRPSRPAGSRRPCPARWPRRSCPRERRRPAAEVEAALLLVGVVAADAASPRGSSAPARQRAAAAGFGESPAPVCPARIRGQEKSPGIARLDQPLSRQRVPRPDRRALLHAMVAIFRQRVDCRSSWSSPSCRSSQA